MRSAYSTILAHCNGCCRLVPDDQKLAQAIGLPEPHTYSGHSLRRGAVTEGTKRGARTSSLQRLGRWRDPRMVQEYIEEAERFSDSAVNVFFD